MAKEKPITYADAGVNVSLLPDNSIENEVIGYKRMLKAKDKLRGGDSLVKPFF